MKAFSHILRTLLLTFLVVAAGLFHIIDKQQSIQRVSIIQTADGYSKAIDDLILCAAILGHDLKDCTKTMIYISDQNESKARKAIAKAKCQGYFWESYDPTCMAIELNEGEEI